MKHSNIIHLCGHSVVIRVALCLFGLSMFQWIEAENRKNKRLKADEMIYLVHADELRYDQFGPTGDAQIVKGRVHFTHQGSSLW